MPDIGETAASAKRKFKLEYTTFDLPALHPPLETGANSTVTKDNFQYPVPLKQLPRALRDFNGTATKKAKKFAPYRLKDLTIGSWVRFARRLGDEKRAKLRRRFEQHMYMGGEE